jgi:hypothetical protein
MQDDVGTLALSLTRNEIAFLVTHDGRRIATILPNERNVGKTNIILRVDRAYRILREKTNKETR